MSASAPQTMFPLASVSRVEAPLQLIRVDILAPPPEMMSPEARVLVEFVLVCNMLPPVMVSPEAEERPPRSTLIPPAKVEVAVPDALIVEPVCRSPETLSLPPMVVEAFVNSPPTNWERLATEREEEAEMGPPTKRELVNVEEAVETSPPEELIEKRVEVAAPEVCWTWKALPVCPVRNVRFRRLAEVVVAPIVTWLSPVGEVWVVVPIIR